MAINTGKGTRKGSIRDRSQIFNPTTGHYIKRDTKSGKFLDVKSDGSAFKGIRKEVSRIRTNPNLNLDIAKKAEKAVIMVRNNAIR